MTMKIRQDLPAAARILEGVLDQLDEMAGYLDEEDTIDIEVRVLNDLQSDIGAAFRLLATPTNK